MTDRELPLPNVREVQERVDMAWLFELAESEHLQPDALREAQRRWTEAQQQIGSILDECGRRDGMKLLLRHDDLHGETSALYSEFWLRLGMVLGMKHMWCVAGLHIGGNMADVLRMTGETDRGFAPSDYLAAVLTAREAMQQVAS